jgi:hypothetical protein
MIERNPAVFADRGPQQGRSRPLPVHDANEARSFPFEPVFRLLVPHPSPGYFHAGKLCRAHGDIASVAVKLGLDRQQIYRYLQQGLGVYVADAVAIRLGRHPVNIWANWFDISGEIQVAA